MMEINLWINGIKYKENVSESRMLIDLLRDKGFLGVKRGCDTSNCGLCTVWVGGKPILSCAYPAARANGKHITTIEGMQEEVKEFGEFLAAQGGEQCGFCSPGFVMSVLAMKKELKNPTQDEIRHYLSGNLCRCTGYMSQMRAIQEYLKATGQGGNLSELCE